MCSINRIRLEFKGSETASSMMRISVLIESDWNLKQTEIFVVVLQPEY